VEVVKSMGVDCEHMAAFVSSTINVQIAGDIMTFTTLIAMVSAPLVKFHFFVGVIVLTQRLMLH